MLMLKGRGSDLLIKVLMGDIWSLVVLVLSGHVHLLKYHLFGHDYLAVGCFINALRVATVRMGIIELSGEIGVDILSAVH